MLSKHPKTIDGIVVGVIEMKEPPMRSLRSVWQRSSFAYNLHVTQTAFSFFVVLYPLLSTQKLNLLLRTSHRDAHSFHMERYRAF